MSKLTSERLQEIRRELEFPSIDLGSWEMVQELLTYIDSQPEFNVKVFMKTFIPSFKEDTNR